MSSSVAVPPSSPTRPCLKAGRPRKNSDEKVKFNKMVRVQYTFSPVEYDRNPIIVEEMTPRDYYEYQIMSFEMHQSIKFELTMKQLGLWPEIDDSPSSSTSTSPSSSLASSPSSFSTLSDAVLEDSSSMMSSEVSSRETSPLDMSLPVQVQAYNTLSRGGKYRGDGSMEYHNDGMLMQYV
ncbi:hypothetical protein BKA69DRAFT_1041350 [Paraphysoderma sedebokerense]|nr:hypothetical protein BKA69DRAFT_1041350 [Paraphysoderma sedebokerense]